MSGKRIIKPAVEASLVEEYSNGVRSGVLADKYGLNRKTITVLVHRNGGKVLPQQSSSGRPKGEPREPKIKLGQPFGERHRNWKGGRVKTQSGYSSVIIRPDNPFSAMAQSNGYVLEHRLIMAQKLGRLLTANETVHHINGDKLDNRPENLQLRHGKHGKGEIMVCGCCGSSNIITKKLE